MSHLILTYVCKYTSNLSINRVNDFFQGNEGSIAEFWLRITRDAESGNVDRNLTLGHTELSFAIMNFFAYFFVNLF